MKKKRTRQPAAHMLAVADGDDVNLFVVFDGKRIAKRGDPDSPQAKTWVSLEPGFVVRDNADMTEIYIEINGVRVH
jgi:predicted peroxiredoxin